MPDSIRGALDVGLFATNIACLTAFTDCAGAGLEVV